MVKNPETPNADGLSEPKPEFKMPIPEVLLAGLARQEFNGKKVGISELEIADTAQFVKTNLKTIREVLRIAKENLDFVFLSCVDVKGNCNRFVVADKESRVFAEGVLGVGFRNDMARREGILNRNEIWQIVKQRLEGK